ncbi:MAG: adenine phosphoribosyltransferase [Saprospiraceae bacterium]|nr:adenine phosphoribosyltransferase [Saprospiraceae bacterium]
MSQLSRRIRDAVRDIPDFPDEGVLFRDITPIFGQPELCAEIIKEISRCFAGVDAVAGIEARGFFFGMAVAQRLGVPFVPIRKKGKLPWKTLEQSYDLEYGSATMEIHVDAIQPTWKVLIHDDILATGGTAEAAAKLIEQVGIVGGFSFLMDLTVLNGIKKLLPFDRQIHSLITY